MQARESRKTDFGCQGVRTDRPYPPFSMKLNSSLRISRMSRSSFGTAETSYFSPPNSKQPAAAYCSINHALQTSLPKSQCTCRNYPLKIVNEFELAVEEAAKTFAVSWARMPSPVLQIPSAARQSESQKHTPGDAERGFAESLAINPPSAQYSAR